MISIIALLIALLLPALSAAREVARRMTCLSNLRSIATGMVAFTVDHKGHLPTAGWTYEGDLSWQQQSWVGHEIAILPESQYPQKGALLPYLNGEGVVKELYRCPALEDSPIGTGYGSNGSLDYSMLNAFAGAQLELLPLKLEVLKPTLTQIPTPLIVQEDSAFHQNAEYLDPTFSSINRLSPIHGGGTTFNSVDGSAHHYQVDKHAVEANDIWAIGPTSGQPISLGQPSTRGTGPYQRYNSWPNR